MDGTEGCGVVDSALDGRAPAKMMEVDGAELEAEWGVRHGTAAGVDAGRDCGRPVPGDEYGVIPAGARFWGLVGMAAEVEGAVEIGVPSGQGVAAEGDDLSGAFDVREGGRVPGKMECEVDGVDEGGSGFYWG